MYDLIGDIHGHADELLELLDRLGYRRRDGHHQHSERKVIFVGGFIDRGPKIREVLNVVRPMIDRGSALAVMGNHEFNAIAYHTPNPVNPGGFLREHSPKNTHQHAETVKQLGQTELAESVEWFRTLPLWLDLLGFRIVHATWDSGSINRISHALGQFGGATTPFIHAATERGSELYGAVATVLKRKEVGLPDGVAFRDPDGHERRIARIKWYESARNQTYRSYLFPFDPAFLDVPVSQSLVDSEHGYPPADKPVFFGHYWLKADRPSLLTPNVACLDYSVAKGGMLCAYRWQDEQQLSNESFVVIPARKT